MARRRKAKPAPPPRKLDTDDERPMPIEAAAKISGVPASEIRSGIRNGDVPTIRRGGEILVCHWTLNADLY